MNSGDAGWEAPFSHLQGTDVWLLLNRINDYLAARHIESYIVGGWVRDVLLGRKTADIDFAVSSDGLDVASWLASALGGKYVLLDEENRVGRVILANEGVAVTGIRGLDFSTLKGDIGQDLAQRDFTIDAMAIALNQFNKGSSAIKITDPFDGQDDLRCGIIRLVAEAALVSDAVRLLRAVRLAAELGFVIEKQSEALLQQHSHLISNIAGERVREELLRLLAVPETGQFLFYLDKLGLLTAIFPELEQARGVEQPREHFWDVFEHSLKTVKAVDFILRRGAWEYREEEILSAVPWSEELKKHFDRWIGSGSNGKVMLKIAALLHDVNKPQTRTVDNTGRIRFLGHSKEGAATVAGIMERLRFSSKEIKLVETEVMHHMRPGQLSQGGLPSHRAVYRYFHDTGEAGIDILFLSLADHLAARGPDLNIDGWKEHTGLTGYVIKQYFEQKNIVHPPKLVDGHDIINIFGVGPGPAVGEMLEEVREAQASGAVTSREEALSFIERLMKK